jgi:hypothetical protein
MNAAWRYGQKSLILADSDGKTSQLFQSQGKSHANQHASITLKWFCLEIMGWVKKGCYHLPTLERSVNAKCNIPHARVCKLH